MKKFNFVSLIFILSLINFSCSKEDENDIQNNTKTLLQGKWKLIEKSVGGNPDDIYDCPEPETITFLNNNSSEHYFVTEDNCGFTLSTYNYKIEDNILTQDIYIQTDNSEIGYTFTNKARIEVLNETTLILSYFYTSHYGEFPDWGIIKQTFTKD